LLFCSSSAAHCTTDLSQADGVSLSGNAVGDPGYSNQAAHDYRVASTSPAASWGLWNGDIPSVPAAVSTPSPQGGTGPGPSSSAVQTSPHVSNAWVSPKRLHNGGRRKKVAHVHFSLSMPASVRVTFEKARLGRRRGHRCVAPGRGRVPRRSRCTRYVAVRGKRLARALSGGPQSLAFTARRGKKSVLSRGALPGEDRRADGDGIGSDHSKVQSDPLITSS